MARDDLLGVAENLLQAVNDSNREHIDQILDDPVLLEDRSNGVQVSDRGAIVELLSSAASAPGGVIATVDDWLVDEARNTVIGHITLHRQVDGVDEAFPLVEDLNISAQSSRVARLRVLHRLPPLAFCGLSVQRPRDGQIDGQ